MSRLPLRFRIVWKNPRFVTCDDIFKHIQLFCDSFHDVGANVFRLSLCYWVRIFGTIFAQTFLMFNRSCKICLTVSLSISAISAIIRMLKRRSFRIFRSFAQRFHRFLMSKGVLDLHSLPVPPDLPWTVCAIQKLACMT
jgi:hypothetical protein